MTGLNSGNDSEANFWAHPILNIMSVPDRTSFNNFEILCLGNIRYEILWIVKFQ